MYRSLFKFLVLLTNVIGSGTERVKDVPVWIYQVLISQCRLTGLNPQSLMRWTSLGTEFSTRAYTLLCCTRWK